MHCIPTCTKSYPHKLHAALVSYVVQQLLLAKQLDRTSRQHEESQCSQGWRHTADIQVQVERYLGTFQQELSPVSIPSLPVMLCFPDQSCKLLQELQAQNNTEKAIINLLSASVCQDNKCCRKSFTEFD